MAKKDAQKDTSKQKAPIAPDEMLGPSPNVATNLAIASIALRGGSMLARQAVERALLGRRYAPKKAANILKGRSFGEAFLYRTIAKVAISSVPGAIAVGGGLLAKTLYDRRQAHKAAVTGEAKLAEMASDGEQKEAAEG